MAYDFSATLKGTTATVGSAGTSVAPAAALPDNCHTVIIFNSDSANTIYVQAANAGGALAADSSVHVPPNSSLNLALGTKSQRVGAYDLVYDCSAGTNVKARITYINGLSS